jgi:hypothetical protein
LSSAQFLCTETRTASVSRSIYRALLVLGVVRRCADAAPISSPYGGRCVASWGSDRRPQLLCCAAISRSAALSERQMREHGGSPRV